MDKTKEKSIQNIKAEILKCLAERGVTVRNIILFGSRARGDFSKFSDYDFVIVIKETLTFKEKMEISKKIRTQLSKYALDVIIKSEQEVEVMKNQIGTVVREALKEGVQV